MKLLLPLLLPVVLGLGGCRVPDVYRIDAAEPQVVEHQHCRVHEPGEEDRHYDCWIHSHVLRDHETSKD